MFDFENGKTVKYDLAKKQAIGIKGKRVDSLQSQLRGISVDKIIQCCTNREYALFLKFIQRCEGNIYNIGTICSRISKYSNYEQIFSAGIEKITCPFSYKLNDIPKSLIKVAKQYEILLTDNRVKVWKQNTNAYYLAYNLEYISLDKNDINRLLFSMCGTESIYNILLNEYGYNAKSLLLYVDSLKTYEALTDVSYTIHELYDYAKMMKTISTKYNKYPRNFLTTHQIACRNYDRLKMEFSEKLFKQRINRKYECTFGKFKFFYPDSTQEIKDEACQQNNCVASYIDRVINGECHILFLRLKDNPDKSLVTIEVRNNKIVQAKGRFNRDVTEEEQKVIDLWNNKFKNRECEIT